MEIAKIQAGEIVGADEIILKKSIRQHSLKVSSDIVKALFISKSNFEERLFNPNTFMRHLMCEKLELQTHFHGALEKSATEFQAKNTNPQLTM